MDCSESLLIARRLSKTRNVSSDEHNKTRQGRQRHKSDSLLFLQRETPERFEEALLKNSGLDVRIKSWLLTSSSDIHEDENVDLSGETHDRKQYNNEPLRRLSLPAFKFINNTNSKPFKTVPISSTSQSTIKRINESGDSFGLTDDLKNAVIKSGCKLVENAKWSLTNCDALLNVNKILFPVEKEFVANACVYFRTLFQNSKTVVFYVLHGFHENEIRNVLNYIYSTEEKKISDENVASLLQQAKEFGISRLTSECETYLRTSKTFNPLISLHLSKQYDLNELHKHSLKEVSKLESIENTLEFEALDLITQNKILKYILQRFQKARKSLVQFDVHLCKYHSDSHKNNNCCFRAATYKTENGRSFLVKMERPEEKLIDYYEKSFNTDSH